MDEKRNEDNEEKLIIDVLPSEDSGVEAKESKRSKMMKLFDKAKTKILEMDDVIEIKNESKIQSDGNENNYITIKINSKLVKMLTAKKVGELLDKKQRIQKRARVFTTTFYVITMAAYIALTFGVIFRNWDDARYPIALAILLGLYVVGFLIVLFINIRMKKQDDSSDESKKQRRLKNYRSISIIMRKLMSLFSLGVAWFVAIETWDRGITLRTISISLIVISSLITIAGIVRNVKAIKKRSKIKSLSKMALAEQKLRDFADNNME